MKILKKNFIFLLPILFCSCNNSPKNELLTLNKTEKFELFKSYFEQVDKSLFDEVYKNATDSIASYETNPELTFLIDSFICFNKKRDLCKFVKIVFNNSKTNFADDIELYYGAKINKKWYFYNGPAILLPRYLYTKNTEKPMSYDKIHEIAFNELLSAYLRFDKKKKPLINDAFFSDLTDKQHFSLFPIAKAKNQINKHWDWTYILESQRIHYGKSKKSWFYVYKPKDFKLYYDFKKNQTTLAMKIHKWDGFPIGYSYRYTVQSGFKTENGENNWDTNHNFDKFLILKQDSIRIVIPNSEPDDDINFRIKFDVFDFENDYMHFKLRNGRGSFADIIEVSG